MLTSEEMALLLIITDVFTVSCLLVCSCGLCGFQCGRAWQLQEVEGVVSRQVTEFWALPSLGKISKNSTRVRATKFNIARQERFHTV